MTTVGYTKLFNELIMSTVWRERDHVRILWITMLALKDRWHVVNSSFPSLADAARITEKECTEALKILSAPDPHSRTKDYEGRRIELCDGGWFILNGEKYRNKMSLDERREYQRIKQREYRARKKGVKSCLQSSQQLTHTDTDTKEDTDNIYTQAFEEIWKIYPKRAGSNPKKAAFKAWKARGDQEYGKLEGTHRYVGFCKATGKIGTEYVMQAKTFFGPDQHYLEDWNLPTPEGKKPWEMTDKEVMAECKKLNINTRGKNKKQLHTEMMEKGDEKS